MPDNWAFIRIFPQSCWKGGGRHAEPAPRCNREHLIEYAENFKGQGKEEQLKISPGAMNRATTANHALVRGIATYIVEDTEEARLQD